MSTDSKKESAALSETNLPLNKKHFFERLKISGKKSISAALILLFVFALAPEAHAYYKYYKSVRAAQNLFQKNDYPGAVSTLQSINQHGLYKSVKVKLDKKIDEYTKVAAADKVFQEAKQSEQNNDFDKAKNLLDSINTDYPKFSDVQKETLVVDEKITDQAKGEAENAKKQVEKEIADKQAAQQAAAKAAAAAAANQAAMQAAQAAAAEQAAAAQAAQEQAAAAQAAAAQAAAAASEAQDTTYINALARAMSLEDTANTYLNDSASAYVSGNFSLATADALIAESTCLSALSALPNSYPQKFYTANNDIVSAINDLNTAAEDLFSGEENADSALLSSAVTYQNTAISYYNRIKSDIASIQ